MTSASGCFGRLDMVTSVLVGLESALASCASSESDPDGTVNSTSACVWSSLAEMVSASVSALLFDSSAELTFISFLTRPPLADSISAVKIVATCAIEDFSASATLISASCVHSECSWLQTWSNNSDNSTSKAKPKLRMSRPNQERSDPIEESRPRRSGPGQTSLLAKVALQLPSVSLDRGGTGPGFGKLEAVEGDARYSRRTLVDGNLNVWPLAVHHRGSSKAIVVEGKLSGNSEFLTFSSEPLHAFDPEIERTLHRLRKARHTITSDSSSSSSIWNSENSNFTTDESNSFEHKEAGSMENNDRTLKELATPDMVYQPLCIQCQPLEPAQSYKLKSSLIHLLPKFHGLAGEDPHKQLKEFHVVCSTMRP
ncbi:hypothetical protein CR513_28150, partial [Mucuna pruriens]